MHKVEFKLWSITSYEDYLENWKSRVGKFEKISNYYKSLGYKDAKDFFETNAIAAQEIANDRVGNIIENVFKTTDLPLITQKFLKSFTYRAIDYLRLNDLVVGEYDRINTTVTNGGRTDTTNISPKIRVEALIGNEAWRSWEVSGIEIIYSSYCESKGIPYLLDEKKFYNKDEINIFLVELDEEIRKNFELFLKTQFEFENKINKEWKDNIIKESKKDIYNDDIWKRILFEEKIKPAIKSEFENFENRIEKEWKDKIVKDATVKILNNPIMFKEISTNVLNSINLFFIGCILWFTNKKSIKNGWVPLKDEKQIVIINTGDEVEVPILRENNFIKHVSNGEAGKIQNSFSGIGQHEHAIFNEAINKFALSQNTFIVSKESDNGSWVNHKYTIAGKLIECGKPSGTGYFIFEKKQVYKNVDKIRELLNKEYSNQCLIDGLTSKAAVNNTVIVNNTSMIAHMYVGVGAKIKLDINKVKQELQPYIVNRKDESQVKYVYWETNFFNSYIKNKILLNDVTIYNDEFMTEVLWSEEDNLYIEIYHNWKDF